MSEHVVASGGTGGGGIPNLGSPLDSIFPCLCMCALQKKKKVYYAEQPYLPSV